MSSEIETKLIALGAPNEYSSEYVDMLRQSSEPIEFIEQFNNSSFGQDGGVGAGYEQIIGSFFKKLYKIDSYTREEMSKRVSDLGIPQDAIDYYCSNICAIDFKFEYENSIPEETSNRFINRAELLMLQLLKLHLGL